MGSKAWKAFAIVEALIIAGGSSFAYVYMAYGGDVIPRGIKDFIEMIACFTLLACIGLGGFGWIFWGMMIYESWDSCVDHLNLSDDSMHSGSLK